VPSHVPATNGCTGLVVALLYFLSTMPLSPRFGACVKRGVDDRGLPVAFIAAANLSHRFSLSAGGL